ncbi:MAG: histidine kinase dimerization/phospho-acceptor domain-containing protein [Aggregatilineales bacterium]
MQANIQPRELEATAITLVNYSKALYNEDNKALTAAYKLDFRTLNDAATRLLRQIRKDEQLPAIDTDILERKQLRHELRNILNLVVGFSQMILREGDKSPLTMLQYATMQSIHLTGKKLLTLVDDIR